MINGLRTQLNIGDYEALRVVRMTLAWQRHNPICRAKIVLPDPLGGIRQLVRQGDSVNIRMGYRDQQPSSWTGTVELARTGKTKDQFEVSAVGNELPLTTHRVTQSWENEAPEAIIRWAVNACGLSAGRIDSPGVTFPRFTAANIPVWQVVKSCSRTCTQAFGLDMSRWALWLGSAGVNWGDFDEEADIIPVVATSAGLIEHRPAGEKNAMLGQVTTFLIPNLRDSMLFRLTDTRRGVDAYYRALEVSHVITPNSARTVIGYGAEYARS